MFYLKSNIQFMNIPFISFTHAFVFGVNPLILSYLRILDGHPEITLNNYKDKKRALNLLACIYSADDHE